MVVAGYVSICLLTKFLNGVIMTDRIRNKMVSRRCQICRGCMQYKNYENKIYLYCDFCDKLYNRVAGGKLIEKEFLNVDRYKYGI